MDIFGACRVQNLDHELVELAAHMPPELKLKEGGKFPLRAIARGLIPDAVIDRPEWWLQVHVDTVDLRPD